MKPIQPAELVDHYYKLSFPDRITFLKRYLHEIRDDIHRVWELLDLYPGDTDSFANAVRQAFERDPYNRPATRLLTWILTREGNFRAAADLLLGLIRTAPEQSLVERREVLRLGFLEQHILADDVLELGRQGLTTPLMKSSYAYQISRAERSPMMQKLAEEFRGQFRSLGEELKKTIRALPNAPARQSLLDLFSVLDSARRVALVGNGPSLKHAQRGQEIERYDIVIRCNFPVIANFAEDVGRRTDAVIFTEALLRDFEVYMGRDPSYKSAKLITIENLAAAAGIDPVEIANKLGTTVARFPGETMQIMRDAFYYHLTTGAHAYLMLAGLFAKQVTIFGFDFYSQKEHYYFTTNIGLPLAHEFQYERFLFQQVVKPIFGAYSR